MTLRYDVLGLDLDGTLLGPGSRISEANLAALWRARAAGLRVVVCTGRGLVECRSIVRQIRQIDPVVVAGGAITADAMTERTIDRVTMSPAIAAEAVARVHETGHAAQVLKDRDAAGFDYLVVTGEGGHGLDAAAVKWFEMLPVEVRFVESLASDPSPEATVRVSAVVEDPWGEQLHAQLAATLGDRVMMHMFGLTQVPPEADGRVRRITAVEVFDPRADKWTGLWGVASRWGVARERIAAIGDEVNDLPMFRGAACAIAMGQASEAVKAAAHRVTLGHAEDGLAHALDKLLTGAW